MRMDKFQIGYQQLTIEKKEGEKKKKTTTCDENRLCYEKDTKI